MVRLTDLKAATLKGLPKVTTAQEAISLSTFSVTLKCPPSFLKVWHRDNTYTVGNWDAWDGAYWVVEDSTGIIHRVGSLSDLKDWIKLCAAVAHGE